MGEKSEWEFVGRMDVGEQEGWLVIDSVFIIIINNILSICCCPVMKFFRESTFGQRPVRVGDDCYLLFIENKYRASSQNLAINQFMRGDEGRAYQ
jgi:hypothetical protein